MNLTYLIIDENINHAESAKELIDHEDNFTCLSHCQDLHSAKKIVARSPIDFIILDPNLSSGKVQAFVASVSHDTRVILYSGRQKDAVTGFEWGVFDFLPKPLTHERWKICSNRLQDSSYKKQKENFKVSQEHLEVRCNLMNEKIAYKNILYIEAMGDYSKIVTHKKKYVVLMSMKKLDALLPEDTFFRIHKSYIVHLKKVTQHTGQHVMVGENKFPLSRVKKMNFRARLQKN